MSDDQFFSKKGQRKVSPFVGHELLYDYITGQLDAERKKSVQEFIDENKEVQSEIQKIQHGMNYVEILSQTQVSEALTERIRIPTSYLQSVLLKIRFDEWPPMVRLALEGSVIALGISLLAIFVPWRAVLDFKIGSDSVILSEVDNMLATKNNTEAEISKEDIAFPDEGSSTEVAVGSSVTTTSLALASASTVTTTTQAKAATTTTMPAKAAKVAATTEATSEEKKTTGFLYRGTVGAANAKGVAPKIAERIAELGARKAGNVELGWPQGKGAYFHFTMPESRYDEMLAVFKEYGEIKISKEKHDRVMPEGIVRVIITVDEKN